MLLLEVGKRSTKILTDIDFITNLGLCKEQSTLLLVYFFTMPTVRNIGLFSNVVAMVGWLPLHFFSTLEYTEGTKEESCV